MRRRGCCGRDHFLGAGDDPQRREPAVQDLRAGSRQAPPVRAVTSEGNTPAMSAILVTGGTGTLGRALVPLLTQAGHQVKVLSRRPRPAVPSQALGPPATCAGATASPRRSPARR